MNEEYSAMETRSTLEYFYPNVTSLNVTGSSSPPEAETERTGRGNRYNWKTKDSLMENKILSWTHV